MHIRNHDDAPRTPLSGTQYELTFGEQRATIASIGATLRSYTAAGRDLVLPFAADELRPSYRGATVAPWPNRVVDGAYNFGGEHRQLTLTEVNRGHALHGFTPWQEFVCVACDNNSVTLRAQVVPQAGYPWRIDIETTYSLDERGLAQTVTATNVGEGDAPYGVCPHPYLVAGEGANDEWSMHVPADSVLLATSDRLIPRHLEPVTVDSDRFDYRTPRLLGDAQIDHAFTDLRRDEAGVARVELRSGGTGVAMTWDSSCQWLQIFTADTHDSEHRMGVAVEPMTCAPDAYNSGKDAGLIALAAGESHTTGWSIAPL